MSRAASPTTNARVVAGANAATLPSRLRAATRDSHDRLERITGLPESIRTPADLRAALEDLYGFHVVAEALGVPAALAALPGFGEAFARRTSASAWLRQDLALLGVTPTETAALPRCTALGPFRTTAARLGCAYVVEGSTLGGRVIHSHLSRAGHGVRQSPVPAPGRPESGSPPPEGPTFGRSSFAAPALRFFAGHGADTARRWQAFTRALDARERPASDDAETIAAAEATFRVLGDWFETRARARRSRRT